LIENIIVGNDTNLITLIGRVIQKTPTMSANRQSGALTYFGAKNVDAYANGPEKTASKNKKNTISAKLSM
jgi:hypothetical protein